MTELINTYFSRISAAACVVLFGTTFWFYHLNSEKAAHIASLQLKIKEQNEAIEHLEVVQKDLRVIDSKFLTERAAILNKKTVTQKEVDDWVARFEQELKHSTGSDHETRK